MRKYYYFTYKYDTGHGYGTNYSDTGCFPLFETMERIQKNYSRKACLTFWSEISYDEYKEMSAFFGNTNE